MTWTHAFSATEEFARHLDASDPLAHFRQRFHLPQRGDGQPLIYFCGHSLGLQPLATRARLAEELDSWAHQAVDGHFRGQRPWYTYQERLQPAAASLLGALPSEVVFMNGLTVNLHLLLATFFRPTRERHAILIDEPTFPSDRYAVLSQLQHHGLAESEALLTVGPLPGESRVREEVIEEVLRREGHRIAVVLLSGLNFLTGQWMDVGRLTRAAQAAGCVVGLDLAHAVGNVPLDLHTWSVDFATFCTYKYLNSGPGAVAGVFVHDRHGKSLSLPRLAGWWGNDPSTRFRMQLEEQFVPMPGAGGWQLSNPPILALAPVLASLQIFDEATLPALRERSVRLTGYLLDLLDQWPGLPLEVLTPRAPEQRGCQVSLRIPARPREVQRALQGAGVVVDFREPDVLRIAPTPLYNTFHEVWSFVRLLAQV